ncbi:MarR family transcriptional regulator [Erythrobacter arachoides]|uniref:MarR family transcriptional regulator n=1 Tax=Aurantiacibacter arachoides TaxID=1850444 RepID=A0A845A2H3_9SPHN|nr:MarR family transcriptional regulator [Aurantiacibacter arachoides]MXO93780.1 MarR family transcriptional regulator [Aurantiacibacter arachoides]GGD46716.1 hypothetical protein GCM10011411_03020 [Aurantiacibacter arachoides]
MAQVDFAYQLAADPAGIPLGVSIFADSALLRADMEDDVAQAGFTLLHTGGLDELLAGHARSLGELVLVDCPRPDGAAMAALTRLDERVAHSGARLIVSTSLDSLDTVFGCCAQGRSQILVNPLRAERVIALGRALAEVPNLRLRELSEDDRLTLLRLTEQVGHIAQRLDKLDTAGGGWGQRSGGGAFRFESPSDGWRAEPELIRKPNIRQTRAPLPDARLVRQVLAHRRARAKFFDGDLFADPAWDMLLDLTAARVEHTRVSVTSLCIASGVPPTTALRWIGQMVDTGLFTRVEDDADRRRAFIELSDKAADAMARYFAEVGKDALAFA